MRRIQPRLPCCLLGVLMAIAFSLAELRAATPYNILFIICDQEQGNLIPAAGYQTPARQALTRRGVVFRNHYTAAAMCSPSRAAFLTGLPPQRTGVFDQMEYPYVPNLNPRLPNMGSVLKQMGYSTAFFGKFEMARELIHTKDTVNYSRKLRPYGFDHFAATGDVGSRPSSGFQNDAMIAAEAVQWLRRGAVGGGPDKKKPFFMVASFLNPHDIMFADVNLPGEQVQKAKPPLTLSPPPAHVLYRKEWEFALPPSLNESLTDPGMPAALAEYSKGWSDALGRIPADRPDMWRRFYSQYLNMIRDNDTALQQIVDVLDEQDLWRNTIVILTADHGEMGGAHGGLRGKGPFAYEQNAKVPFIVVHPDFPAGTSDVLTSHLDLLPTLVSFAGATEAKARPMLKGLPGKDFTPGLRRENRSNPNAIRKGALFQYVGLLTLDASHCTRTLTGGSGEDAEKATDPAQLRGKLGKRGFLTFVSDGRYKLARFYAPDNFNTPVTLDELFAHNDVQLFDLQNDPNELVNLAMDRVKHRGTLARMNSLMNELMAREVGVNNGAFLPAVIRPTGVPALKLSLAPK
ncbi:MAG: sulfatase-like hydrolase/transferase [Limisphaerales bacterium]